MPRRTALLIALAVLVLGCLPLRALEYEVRMVSGNTFITRYEPVVAPFDSTRMMFMTVNGNPITVARDQVKEVISLTEASGFGKRLDALTVLIGLAANDNPTPEEQAALEAQAVVGELAGVLPLGYSADQSAETVAALDTLTAGGGATPPAGGSPGGGPAPAPAEAQQATDFWFEYDNHFLFAPPPQVPSCAHLLGAHEGCQRVHGGRRKSPTAPLCSAANCNRRKSCALSFSSGAQTAATADERSA